MIHFRVELNSSYRLKVNSCGQRKRNFDRPFLHYCIIWTSTHHFQSRYKEVRCHSGFVLPRKCSGGTTPLADTFRRNTSASVGVPPGTFLHARIRSGPHKCSASVNLPNERVHFCLKALGMLTSIFTCI